MLQDFANVNDADRRVDLGIGKRPRILDTFCGAGGCSVGYHRAGFDVVGIDKKPQPRYPFDFIQADVLDILDHLLCNFHDSVFGTSQRGYVLDCFDAIHASPPCQAFSAGKQMWKNRLPDDRHPDLVEPIRKMLARSGKPYVIENVVGAPLRDPTTLCGDMFGLAVVRHRLFESNIALLSPPKCRKGHPLFTVSVFGGGALSRTPGGGWSKGRGNFMQKRVHVPHEDAKKAMGIDWMTRDELSQAIPPAYTEYIGRQLIRHLQGKKGVSA